MSMMQAEGQNDALAALAIGLGAMKATDTLDEMLGTADFGGVPKVLKGLFASGVCAAGVWFCGTGGMRRRVLMGGSAAGFAALAHAAERALRYRGDESKVTVISRQGLLR